MQFPLWFDLGFVSLHPHLVLEALGYIVGLSLMAREGSRRGDSLDGTHRGLLIIMALLGAIIGAKTLAWLEHAPLTLQLASEQPFRLIGGKTIVGGLLGGTLAVELVKKRLGVTERTGDIYVTPLLVSISIGRLGCFLSGMDDMTFGYHSDLPWAVDFGDGPRHPTQLYEILFLGFVGARLFQHERAGLELPPGARYQLFMIFYLGWRLSVDFIKPADLSFLLLSPIQWACVFGVIYFLRDYQRTLVGGD
jgi:phosphatidylglycerol:prolipoprotein diacylglycerol transferase